MHSIRAGIGRTGIGASGTAMRLGTHSAAANDVHCRWVTMMMVIHQRVMLHLSTPILTTQVGKKKIKKKKETEMAADAVQPQKIRVITSPPK